jgi:hypothetical protein
MLNRMRDSAIPLSTLNSGNLVPPNDSGKLKNETSISTQEKWEWLGVWQ